MTISVTINKMINILHSQSLRIAIGGMKGKRNRRRLPKYME